MPEQIKHWGSLALWYFAGWWISMLAVGPNIGSLLLAFVVAWVLLTVFHRLMHRGRAA